MPAIHPARLKLHVAQLAEDCRQPEAFVRNLHSLLDHYADRTYRPGQAGEPHPLLPAYNVPPPVLRQLAQALAPLAEEDPPAALALCDALWAEAYLELRLLAAMLLGRIPASHTGAWLDRLERWVRSGAEDQLLDALLSQGLARLRKDDPNRVVKLAEGWLAAPEVAMQTAGLRTLLALLAGQEQEVVPAVFRLITPFVRVAPQPLRPDLLAVLRRLAHLSPRETAHFMQQNLSAPDNPDTAWLLRLLAIK